MQTEPIELTARKGHRVLYRLPGSRQVHEADLTEFAHDDQFVRLGDNWEETANVGIVHDFDEKPPVKKIKTEPVPVTPEGQAIPPKPVPASKLTA